MQSAPESGSSRKPKGRTTSTSGKWAKTTRLRGNGKRADSVRGAASGSDEIEAPGEVKRGIGVFSEVGRLRKVFVHTPGTEVESMTPETATELLFNEIIHYSHVKRSHAELKAVLGQVSEVLEVSQCLADILSYEDVKVSLLRQLLEFGNCQDLLPELLVLSKSDLAEVLITGVPLKRDSLTNYLSRGHFSLVPLPNMYFMRDSSVVVGRRNISSAMASPVRGAESIIMRALYQHHPKLIGKGLLLDGLSHAKDPDFSIEGGDVLVFSEDVILVGISERTTSQAVDALVERLIQARREDGRDSVLTLFCVLLPRERATIHLDMIFTFASQHQAVVHEPYVLGRKVARVVRVRVESDGTRRFKDMDNLITGLKTAGVRIDPIICGGDNPLYQEREQWNSGANLFAFAPGQVVCYEMHEHTVEACRKAGFRVASASEVSQDSRILQNPTPIVVTVEGSELARGGGGPRCMTCPVLRDPLPESD